MIKGRRRLTEREMVDIVNAFTEELVPVVELAGRHQYSRQGIYKVLRRYGVDPATSGRIDVTCPCCGNVFQAMRCRVRDRKHLFCSQDCYTAWLVAGAGTRQGPYLANRHGMRVARHKVSEVFDLQPGHIVHHEDRNNLNNDLRNLKVFSCQGDHIRYHRGFDVLPIWDGSAA